MLLLPEKLAVKLSCAFLMGLKQVEELKEMALVESLKSLEELEAAREALFLEFSSSISGCLR